MLSEKEIEEISKFIIQGDEPQAIVNLIQSRLQKQMEQKGAEIFAQRRSHYIWDTLQDSDKAVACISQNGKILDTNSMFTKMFKLTREEVTGLSIFAVLDAREELFLRESRGDIIEMQYEEFQLQCMRNDGKQMYMRVERYPGKEEEALYLVFSDITEQKRYEETITQDSIRCEIFIDIVDALWQDFMNYERTLDTLTNKVSQHIGGSCIIHLFMEQSDIIEHVAINHQNPKATTVFQNLLYTTRWHASRGLPSEVVLGGNAVLVPHVTKDNIDVLDNKPFGECVSALGTSSLIVVPMYLDENVIGTMTLLRTGTEQPYTNRDKSFTQRIANIGALAILNAQRMKRMNTELVSKLRTVQNDYCKNRLLEAVVVSITALLVSGDMDELLPLVLTKLVQAVDAESALLILGDPDSPMQIRGQWSRAGTKTILSEAFGNELKLPAAWIEALQENNILFKELDDFSEDGAKEFQQAGITSLVVMPVSSDDRLIGATLLENTEEHAECFENNSESLKTLMIVLGEWIQRQDKAL